MGSVRWRGGPQTQAPAVPNYLPPEVDVGRRIAGRAGFVANDTDETVLADRTAGLAPRPLAAPDADRRRAPRLTEPWFC